MKKLLLYLMMGLTPMLAIAANSAETINLDDFYTTLPAIKDSDKLGQLIKSEPIATRVKGVKAWKIAYISSDVMGRKTIVTGLVAYPSVATTKKEGRPIVAWAHGTTGTAQNCGPSQVFDPVQPLSLYFMPNNSNAQWGDIGIPALEELMKAGYVVVATDYQGLGGGGKHQYTVAATQAHDVINSVRAVKQLRAANASNHAIVYGWSQGGGATIAAASQIDYIKTKGTAVDGINFIGFVAIAPYDIAVALPDKNISESDVLKFNNMLHLLFVGKSANDISHYTENLWGITNAFPELKLTDILTESAAVSIDEVMRNKCVHGAANELDYLYGHSFESILRPDIQNIQNWVRAYKQGSVEARKPIAPVMIYYGNHDITVPPLMSDLYRKQMCALGGNITRVQFDGKDHITSVAASESAYIAWMAERFAGNDLKNGCVSN